MGQPSQEVSSSPRGIHITPLVEPALGTRPWVVLRPAFVGTGRGRGGCGVPADRRERNRGLAACCFPHPPRLLSLQCPRPPRATCQLVLPLEKASVFSQGSLFWTEHSISVFSYRLQCYCYGRIVQPAHTSPICRQRNQGIERSVYPWWRHRGMVGPIHKSSPPAQVLCPQGLFIPSGELGVSTLFVCCWGW